MNRINLSTCHEGLLVLHLNLGWFYERWLYFLTLVHLLMNIPLFSTLVWFSFNVRFFFYNPISLPQRAHPQLYLRACPSADTGRVFPGQSTPQGGTNGCN
jgi:hypothetical protein